jgi:hypothetical protein
MNVRRMPFFHDFVNHIMDGFEFRTYRVQAISLSTDRERSGFFEKVIKGPKRVLVVNYYLSIKLDTLFVLTAHITRAGEPREKEKEALEKYLAEIKALEGNK